MTEETTSRHFEWNHSDQMKAFRTQTVGAEPSVHAHYLYDAAGQRVKKLVRNQGGQVEVTHYIDGVFEHHRWGKESLAGETNHIHVMDDKRRVALVRLGAAHPKDRGPAVQLQLGDHLGNSNAVTDQTGVLIHREEFTPYGETSFGSFARKRYRFTGMERDGDSGLNYHGARYYASWLGRWCATDPIQMAGGMNQYRYCMSNPVIFADTNGKDFSAVFDFDRGRVTLRSTFIVNTPSEANQLSKAVRAYNVAVGNYRGWTVGFDVKIRIVTYPVADNRQPLREGVYLTAMKDIVPLANFYANALNRNRRHREVQGDAYVGGTTYDANNIVMNNHDKFGDQGEYTDAVKHEISHTFGLDDEGGGYYVRGGITDYQHLKQLRSHSSVGGFDRATISDSDIQGILRFVYEYDPSVHAFGTQAFIPDTPRTSFTRVQGGIRKDFHTFDAMWSDFVHDSVTRSSAPGELSIENLDALGERMRSNLLNRLGSSGEAPERHIHAPK